MYFSVLLSQILVLYIFRYYNGPVDLLHSRRTIAVCNILHVASIASIRVYLWTRFLIGFQFCRLANQIIRFLIDSELVVCGINNNRCTWSGQVSVRTKSSTEVSIGSRWSDDSLYELLLFKGKNDHFRSFWIITWKQKKIEKIFQLMKWSAGLAL